MSLNNLININKKVIDSYLYYYITYIKFIDLDKQYNDVSQYERKIKKFINDKYNKYKIDKQNICNLVGGDKLMDKINKIYEVSKIYKSINFDDIAIKKKEMDENLTKISETLSKNFDNTEQVLKIIADNKILNTIDLLSANIIEMKDGFNVIPEAINLNLPIEQVKIPLVDSFSVFITMSKKYRQQLNEINNNISLDQEQKNFEYNILLNNIRNDIIELEKSIEIENVINIFKDIYNKFQKQLLFNYNADDVIKIESIDELISKLKFLSSSNKEINNFVNNKLPLFETNKIRQNKFIDLYNKLVSKLDPSFVKDNNLPNPYFNGGYVIRVTNNLLLSPSISKFQLGLLDNLVSVSEEDLLYKEFSEKSIKDISIIYKPDFSTFTQSGGGSLSEVEATLGEFDIKIRNISDKIFEYNQSVMIYNTIQIYLIMHTLFLTLIATNQILINNYTIYVYINKGLLEFYKKILIKINNDIDNNVMTEDIMYMRKYHYITIKKLLNFTRQLSSKIDPKDIIDIRRCKGDTAKMFLLLNYFKLVLESHNAMFQNKITIYSRINDIGYVDVKNKDYTKEVFLSDEQYKKMINDTDDYDSKKMWIQKKKRACKDFIDEMDEYLEFTQVFDTENFPYNSDIAKYMTLDTQLAKGISLGIMTYGYSGTGKTYTLFGNKTKVNEDGLLQFTVDNINGLLKLKLRVYEIYGYGLVYPHYWVTTNGKSRMKDIYNRIYHYHLLLDLDSINFDNVYTIEAKDIENYTNHAELLRNKSTIDKATSYIDISNQQSEIILKNFDSFVDKIEVYRKSNSIKRIRDTPNNTVSSRSILVYDFQLYIDDINKPPVPFLIIDLPGREEIIKTYVDSYIDNPVIKNILLTSPVDNKVDINNKEGIILYYKFLISVMCINPLAVPIFNDRIIYDTVINNYADILKKEISMEFLYFDDPKNKERITLLQKKYNMIPYKGNYKIIGVKNKSGFTFDDEIINLRGTTIKTIRDNLNKNINMKGFGYIASKYNKYQYYATLSIHIMNRLILENRFDIIEEIYKNICQIEINNKIEKYIDGLNGNQLFNILADLIEFRFKGDFIELAISKGNLQSDKLENIIKYIAKQITENKRSSLMFDTYPRNLNNNDIKKLKEDIKDLLKYDYYLTPFEGIYINENIIGLIKYLASKMIIKEDERQELESKFKKQSLNLDFVFQQKIARMWLISNVVDNKRLIEFYNLNNESEISQKLFDSYDGELRFNYRNMLNEYNKFQYIYKPDAIYNFENPLIESILKPYIKYIDDYKIFYLFANYENELIRDLKCANQYKLLNNTEDFIKAITK